MKKSGPNIRQRKFIDNLFLGMSQKAAYIEAGYKDDESNASRLTSNDKVKEEIERRLADIGYRNRIRLARISETGLAKLLVIIKDDEVDFKTKLDAIKDTLDRVGLKPVERLRDYGERFGFKKDIPKLPFGEKHR